MTLRATHYKRRVVWTPIHIAAMRHALAARGEKAIYAVACELVTSHQDWGRNKKTVANKLYSLARGRAELRRRQSA